MDRSASRPANSSDLSTSQIVFADNDSRLRPKTAARQCPLMTGASPRPSRADLAAAAGLAGPDVTAPGPRVLVSGIKPGLYSAAAGHPFPLARHRFFAALAQSA